LAAHGLTVGKPLEINLFSVRPTCYTLAVADEPPENEVQLDPDADVRARIHDLLREIEDHHGGRRIRRLELERRADHVAVYPTFLSHLRDPA
jgi:hypothetical protein